MNVRSKSLASFVYRGCPFDEAYLAACLNRCDVLKAIEINPTLYEGRLNPLHCAASNLAYEAALILRSRFLRWPDEAGKTSLRHFLDSALSNELYDQERIESFSRLLSDEALITAADGKPTLHLALLLNAYGLIDLTFEAQKDCVDTNGTTTLMVAAKSSRTDYFPQLRHQLRSCDMKGKNAAFYAVQADNVDFLLLAIDELYNDRDAEGRTLLHEAARFNALRCLEVIRSTYLNNADNYGNPALFEAAFFNHRWAAQMLAEEVFLTNQNNDTALHFAAKNDCFDVVDQLQEVAGIRNNDGKLAIEISIDRDAYNVLYALLVIESPNCLFRRIIETNAFKSLIVLFKIASNDAASPMLRPVAKRLICYTVDDYPAIFTAIRLLHNEVVRVLIKYGNGPYNRSPLEFAVAEGYFGDLDLKAQQALTTKFGFKK